MNKNFLQRPPRAEISAAKRAARLETTPDKFKPLMKRVYAGTASPRECAKAACLECVGFNRRTITQCPSCACALWNVRPFKSSVSSENAALNQRNPQHRNLTPGE